MNLYHALMNLLGTPVHPSLVHFPIGLFTFAFLFALLGLCLRKPSFTQTALYLFTAATLISPIVALTGEAEQNRLHLHHPLLDIHETSAFILVGGSLILTPVFLWISKKHTARLALVLTIALGLFTSLSLLLGYTGGHMVYKYAVGIEK